MGFIPEEYKFRREGLHAWIDMHIYFSMHPGPREEKTLPYRFSTMMLDEAYEAGGLERVEDFLDVILNEINATVNKDIKEQLMSKYREAAKEANRPTNRFGPLGAFLEIGRPDIIKKVALEEHERKKGQ